MSKVTEDIIKQFRSMDRQRNDALAEVLCAAYKDCTGRYPDDYTREKIHQAVGA